MSDLAQQILAAAQVMETLAQSKLDIRHLYAPERVEELEGVLRRCAADREIVAEVMSWKHFYLDGDTWYSCGLSVDPSSFLDDEPGSGCANDDDKGHCTCGLEYRQRKILDPLARGYGIQP